MNYEVTARARFLTSLLQFESYNRGPRLPTHFSRIVGRVKTLYGMRDPRLGNVSRDSTEWFRREMTGHIDTKGLDLSTCVQVGVSSVVKSHYVLSVFHFPPHSSMRGSLESTLDGGDQASARLRLLGLVQCPAKAQERINVRYPTPATVLLSVLGIPPVRDRRQHQGA